MKCHWCGTYCHNRPSLFVHISKCPKRLEGDGDSSVPDDTDEDPSWSPEARPITESESSSSLSPVPEEQDMIASAVKKLFDDQVYLPTGFATTLGQDMGTSTVTSGTGNATVCTQSKATAQELDCKSPEVTISSVLDNPLNIQQRVEICASPPMEDPLNQDDLPNCLCGIKSIRAQVFRDCPEKGRFFFTCKKEAVERCHFFQWVEDSSIAVTQSTGVERTGETDEAKPDAAAKDKYKKYFCVFCSSLVDHFPRHLFNKHIEEKEVAEIASLKVGCSDRKKLIAKLRGKGSLVFNTDYSLNKGKLISARRLKSSPSSKKLKPCIICKNFFSQESLYKHYKFCTGKPQTPRDLQTQSSIIIMTSKVDISNRMKNDVLPGMKKDDIYNYILEDEVILTYGNYLCTRHKLDRHLTNMIRTKLRQLAKLTLSMKNIDPNIKDLDTALAPQHYDTFVKAVLDVVGFHGDNFKSPSLVGELGRAMKLVANRRIIDYIKRNDNNRKEEIEKWLHIFSYDYYHNVGKSALIHIQRTKYGKVRVVPLIEDVMKVKEYIGNELKKSKEILDRGFDMKAYEIMNKCIMTDLQIFNRKRAGEIEMFTLDEFKARHSINKESDIYQSLQTSEKICSNRYVRVETRGKLNLRPAAFLINPMQVEMIELLISYRNEAGIDKENPYVFARRNKFYEACKSLSEIAYASNAVNPELITGTWLRKQIATTTQALSFTENEMTNLASFLGHDIKTHRQFYRLPSDAIHLAKISKLLQAMDEGCISKYYGKSLAEIDVTLNTVLTENVTTIDEADSSQTNVAQTQADDIDYPIAQEEEEETTHNAIHSEENDEETTFDTPDYDENQLSKKKKRSPVKNKKQSKLNRGLKTPPKNMPKKRQMWKTPERQLVRKLFREYIVSENTKLPTPLECRTAIRNNKELQGRTIGQIKGWIFSERRRFKRD